jgi:hypothetical protein
MVLTLMNFFPWHPWEAKLGQRALANHPAVARRAPLFGILGSACLKAHQKQNTCGLPCPAPDAFPLKPVQTHSHRTNARANAPSPIQRTHVLGLTMPTPTGNCHLTCEPLTTKSSRKKQ